MVFQRNLEDLNRTLFEVKRNDKTWLASLPTYDLHLATHLFFRPRDSDTAAPIR